MAFDVPGPALPHQDLDVPGLVSVWAEAMADFRAAAVSGGDETWHAPTPCPGWSVGDVVAHVTSLERAQLHEQDPPHEPDWSALPHVTDDFGRHTEVPVDLRRGRSREEVFAEFDRTISARHEALAAGPQDQQTLVENPFGDLTPIGRMLSTRIFDTWVHEQDVLVATHAPETHLASRPAWVAAGRMVETLGYVWAKRVDAPTGATLHVRVTGPGVMFTVCSARQDDGKGVLLAPISDPTVSLRLGWPDYVALSCGRVSPEQAADQVSVAGDTGLARAFLSGMPITP